MKKKFLLLYGLFLGLTAYSLVSRGEISTSAPSKSHTKHIPPVNRNYRDYNSAQTLLSGEMNTSSDKIFAGSLFIAENKALDIQNGLTAYYPFNGNANDESGNGNHGIPHGASLSADRYNAADKAYSFSTTTDLISTTTYLQGPQTFTISIWLKTQSAEGKIIGFERTQTGTGTSYDRHLFLKNNGTLYFGVYNSGFDTISTNFSINDNAWHHLAASIGIDGQKLYVDGTLISYNDAVKTAENSYGYWRIGFGNLSRWADKSIAVIGSVDDARIYNRALNEQEIGELFNEKSSGSSGLVAYYPFNGNAYDESGNSNHGTVNGASLVPDRFGYENSAYRFDGIDDEIVIQNSPSLNPSSISVSLWVKPENIGCYQTFISKGGNGSGYTSQYELYYCNLIRYLSSNSFETSYQFSSKTALKNSEWQHVVLTQSGLNLKLYINGTINAQVVSTREMANPTSQNLYFGAEARHVNTTFFTGALDDIRIYNREINEDEVKELYDEQGQPQHLRANFSVDKTKSCSSFTAVFQDLSTGNPTSWLWDFGDGTTSNVQNPAHTYSGIGAYDISLIVSDSEGYKDTIVLMDYIKLFNPPVTYVIPDTSICPGANIELFAHGGIAYQWSTGETTDRIIVSPDNNIKYYVTIIGEGCDVKDSVQVSVLDQPEKPNLTVENDSKILCPSESRVLSTNSSGIYLWNTGETSGSVTITNPGSYYVRVENQNHCYAYSDTVKIERDTPIEIQLLNNPSTLCRGDNISLAFSGNAVTYNWSNGQEKDTLELQPQNSMSLYLTANSKNGCYYNDSVRITVVDAEGDLASPVNLIPPDEKVIFSRELEFSWNPVKYASTYDFFIWKEGPAPSEPAIRNIEGLKIKYPLDLGTAYQWKVAAKNSCQYAESTIQTLTVSNLPELIVDTIIAPEEVFADEYFEVKWRIKNTGEIATNVAAWFDRLYLTPDMEIRIGEPEDWRIAKKENPMALEPNQYYEQKVNLKIPGSKIGTQFLGVVTDLEDALFIDWEKMEAWAHGGNVLPEVNDYNNFLFKKIKIKVPLSSDLVVQNIGHGASCFSNTTIPISYEIINKGKANLIKTRWLDKIYLSTVPELDNTAKLIGEHWNDAGLASDSILKINTTVYIPLDIYGDCYLFVVTDARNTIAEYYFDGNNVQQSDKAIRVTLSPTPDLIPFNINIPLVLSRGSNTIEYSVKNQGVGNTNAQQWMDEVQICADASFAKDKTESIVQKAILSMVKPGETYFHRYVWNIPDNLYGQFYIRIKIDASDKVFEYNKEANNVFVQKVTIPKALTPDMRVVDGRFNQNILYAGETYTFDYTVENTGENAVQNKALHDAFKLQESNAAEGKLLNVGSYQQYTSLEINQAEKRSVAIFIPPDLSGEYNFITSTNSTGGFFENDFSNNTHSTKVKIEAKLPLQFLLSNLQAPEQVVACSSLKITWKVSNSGKNQALEGEYKDKLYLSGTNQINANSSLLKTFTYNDNFLAGEIYTGGGIVEIPCGIEGDYFFILENISGSGNNLRKTYLSAPVKVIPVEYPDLKIGNTVSESTGLSGQPHPISYTVSNEGKGNTTSEKWMDAIYLSADKVIDKSDKKLLEIIHEGKLSTNTHYQKSASVDLPSYLMGNYYLLIRTDDSGIQYETDRDNNVAALPILLEFTPLTDIAVSKVEPPAEAEPERKSEVAYTLRNSGDREIDYWVTNGLFLSKDTAWDIDDYNTSYHKQQLLLPPGNQQNYTIQHLSPVLQPGDYYFIVKANQKKSVSEINWDNNTKASSATTKIVVEALEMNAAKEITISKNQHKYLKLIPPEGETIEIKIESNDFNALNSLYASYEYLPEKSRYDLMAYNQSSNPVLTIPESKEGIYYLLISNEDCLAKTSLTISARVVPFEIKTVNDSRGGNNSDISFEVTGSKFSPNMDLRLERHGQFIAADELYFTDPANLMATFNLRGAEIGKYDVVAQLPDGETAILKNGFLVEAAKAPELGSFINGPEAVRRERKFAIEISYWNNGNSNLRIKGLIVKSTGGSPIAMKIEELDSLYSELYIPINEPKTEAGILRPGYRGLKTIYCYSTKEVSISLSAIMPKRDNDWIVKK